MNAPVVFEFSERTVEEQTGSCRHRRLDVQDIVVRGALRLCRRARGGDRCVDRLATPIGRPAGNKEIPLVELDSSPCHSFAATGSQPGAPKIKKTATWRVISKRLTPHLVSTGQPECCFAAPTARGYHADP